jgi:L-fucose isomerase-like protein
MKKLTIGFAAGFMDGFSKAGLETFAQYKVQLEKLGRTMGFEVVYYPKAMMTVNDARAIREDLDAKDVDFLLLFHPAYIIGDNVYELMKTRARLGLWAIEEPREDGPMPLASFVNLCQNMGIAHQMFKAGPKKVKWFFGPMDGPLFKPRFEITVKALLAVKNLMNARVAQIGKLADGHINHTLDNRDIYARLGIDVNRDFEVEDVMAIADTMPEAEAAKELEAIDKSCAKQRIGNDKIMYSVKLALAVRKLAAEHDWSAVAFSCWPKLMPLRGMSGCLVNALLNNGLLPGGCEADVGGTVSMLVLKLLSGQSTVLMDLPRFDTADNSLMIWHCGTSPFDMANKRGVLLERHYFADYSDDPGMKDCGPAVDVVFKPGDMTAFRITGEADSFYYFTGRFTDTDKKTFSGSRGWVTDLKLYREPVKVLDLMNTIMTRAWTHHYPMVLKDVSAPLEELAYWLDLKRVPKAEYRDYLSVD